MKPGVVTAEDEGRPARAVEELVSFDELYRQCYDRMVRLAYLFTSNEGVAEELVQDAFVRVHRRWDGVEKPAGYLRAAVVNACRSWQRRQALERVYRPERRPEGAQQAPDELGDVLAGLPGRQRAALLLRFYEDLPENEIASVLGCRPGTVKSLIHRGLGRVRQEIER